MTIPKPSKKASENTRIVAALWLLLIALPVHAQVSIDFPDSFAGFSSQDLKVIIQNIIRIILGFMGILVVLMILAGGLKWMTSGGNEEKIAEAKKLITASVVGLTIILVSYSIANFIISSLQQAV